MGAKVQQTEEGLGARGPEKMDQNDPSSTAEALAEQYGVSAPTIKRDGQFAQAVETLKPHVPDIAERVMSGEIPSKQAVIEAAQYPGDVSTPLFGNRHVYPPRLLFGNC